MKKQTKRLLIFLTLLPLQANVHAAENSYMLPLTLAVEAANETVRSCEALGYNVSVAFVDMSGQPRVQLKSDKSTPHTFETAYRKAYTIVTFGPNYHIETSGQVADLMSKNPAIYNAVLTIPNVTPLPGALAIKVKGNIIGAIGVSGAPGGDKDEACAQAGIDKISSRLPE
ncbi:heme-binding protein [Methylomonas sp. UP202]|uniref:GlcG/HbpS family heme-binding protein n=1 Tax=Methylomonas sp. UP202 TaxID=3040943 RepID=UPI0024790003|nr:heme-binding protein [Methylomonas sp. UP202]WGS84009.1 heme-binding protein [Methylomonas sp. UP202]